MHHLKSESILRTVSMAVKDSLESYLSQDQANSKLLEKEMSKVPAMV